MNDRSLEQVLDAWLDAGPKVAPGRVAEAARFEIRSTRQAAGFGAWPPRRFPIMSNTMRVALATAAVAVAALLGFKYLVAPNVGSPGLDDPTPTPASFDDQTEGADLPPGTYVMTEVSGFRITFTVPAGWQNVTTPGLVWGDRARMGFWTIDNLYADPCPDTRPTALEPRDPPVGPTVDDLVSALEDIGSFMVITELAEVAVDGYAGKRLELRFGGNESCIGAEPVLWPINDGPEGKPAPAPGWVDLLWILDVDGNRLVISSTFRFDTASEVLTELQQILDSLHIEPA